MRGFYLLICILAFAPLVHGGNRPLPLLLLELAAVALFAFILQKPEALRRMPRVYLGLLAAIFIFPLLQLIQLPFELWRNLPGHTAYANSLVGLGESSAGSARATTLVPSLTEYAWLALLPPLAVFLFTVSLAKEQLRTLVVVFLGIATFEAILGLMQYGSGATSWLRLGNTFHGISATGTYANRDHLAGLLEMALPLSLAMLSATLGRSQTARRHTRTLRQRLALLASTYLNQTAVFGVIAIAILLGLVFSHSRTGNALGILVILLSTVAFSARLGGRNVYGVIGTFTAISVALAVVIGLVPVLNRFAKLDPMQDGRWLIFNDVFTAIGEFFPLGSGFGTFDQVFPRFQTFSFNGAIINRAHNDYLEWIMEGGIIAAILILAFLAFYISRWPKVWKRGEWKTFNFIQVGAGIGLFAMILHTFVDFNLHIPANQIYFAFLAALFFYSLDNEASEAPTASLPDAATHAPKPEQATLPVNTIKAQIGSNPFSE